MIFVCEMSVFTMDAFLHTYIAVLCTKSHLRSYNSTRSQKGGLGPKFVARLHFLSTLFLFLQNEGSDSAAADSASTSLKKAALSVRFALMPSDFYCQWRCGCRRCSHPYFSMQNTLTRQAGFAAPWFVIHTPHTIHSRRVVHGVLASEMLLCSTL